MLNISIDNPNEDPTTIVICVISDAKQLLLADSIIVTLPIGIFENVDLDEIAETAMEETGLIVELNCGEIPINQAHVEEYY